MWFVGALLALHGGLMLLATIGGVIGYVQRGLVKDAVGTALMFGISILAEIVLGLTLIL